MTAVINLKMKTVTRLPLMPIFLLCFEMLAD